MLSPTAPRASTARGVAAGALALLLVAAAPAARAQPASDGAAGADVASLDALVDALYSVISGPAGQARDWDRMRALFLPGARLVGAALRPDGTYGYRAMTVDDYVATSGPWMLEHGFFESELARRTERFGAVAHVWSTYEGRQTADGAPFVRGVNSIQALYDGERWWVVGLAWSPEHDGEPLPAAYLPPE